MDNKVGETLETYLDQLIEKAKEKGPGVASWNQEILLGHKEPALDYIDGLMLRIIPEISKLKGDKKYLEFADGFMDYHVEENGSIKKWDTTDSNLDNINAGRALFDLFELTHKEKYRKAIDTVFEQIKHQPRTLDGKEIPPGILKGNFWHKKKYPHQVWLDGLFMAQPFYAKYATLFSPDKEKLYEDIFNQFCNVEKLMKDPKTGLYYHGYDSSRKMYWCDQKTGCSPSFWLRSLGWYTMALIDTPENMDTSNKKIQPKFKQMFRNLIDALIPFQHESGMWYNVVDQGDRKGNYLETSGSAMMAYAILKGVRMGFLPKEYREYGEKAFNGICEKYLTEEDGKLHLGGICLVGGLGDYGGKSRNGSFEYYNSEPIVKDEAKGIAPLLLAYTEMLKLQNMQN